MPCLLVIFIGGTQVVFPSDASHPTFAVVAGLMLIIGGGVMLFSIERGYRKRHNTPPRPAAIDPAPRIPPAVG